MNLKSSFLVLLIGLISQAIAAPNYVGKSTEQAASNNNLAPGVEYKKTTNDSLELDEILNSLPPIEEYERENNRIKEILSYLETCKARNTTSVFFSDAIIPMVEVPADDDDGLSFDEIKIQVQQMVKNILDTWDPVNYEKILNQAAEDLISIILSTKRSDLHNLVRLLEEFDEQLGPLVRPIENDIYSFMEPKLVELMTLALVKEDPLLTSYLFDFVIEIFNNINQFEKSNSFDKMAESLQPFLKIAEEDKKLKEPQPLVEMIIVLFDKISSLAETNIPDNDKIDITRCVTEDLGIGMLARTLVMKFYDKKETSNIPLL